MQYGAQQSYHQGMNYGMTTMGMGQPTFGGGQQQVNVLDLDPYASSSFQSPPSGPSRISSSASVTTASSPAQSHPKQFVSESKALLSSFDPYTWKQLLNRIDGVQERWEQRRTELLDARMKGADYERVESAVKEATNHIDSILASKFQLSVRSRLA